MLASASARGHDPTAAQAIGKASEEDTSHLSTWHKINFPFSPYCPPLLPPHDNVDFAPAMRHDILGLALRIGCNIAEIGGEGEQQKREVNFVSSWESASTHKDLWRTFPFASGHGIGENCV